MVDPGVKNAHTYMVNPYVRPQEHKETVLHHPESHIRFTEPLVSKFIFEKLSLPVVENRITHSKLIKRNVLLV